MNRRARMLIMRRDIRARFASAVKVRCKLKSFARKRRLDAGGLSTNEGGSDQHGEPKFAGSRHQTGGISEVRTAHRVGMGRAGPATNSAGPSSALDWLEGQGPVAVKQSQVSSERYQDAAAVAPLTTLWSAGSSGWRCKRLGCGFAR